MKYLPLFFLAPLLLAQPVFTDARYSASLVHSGNGMTVIRFDATGRLFVAEKRGQILVIEPDGSGGFLAATDFADFVDEVDATAECGLLGMALDPDFLTTRYIYLFYTTTTDQRLVRITSNSSFTAMEAGSELTLVDGFPRTASFHKAGGIVIDPQNEAIFISLGDDGFDGVSPLFDGLPRVQHPDFWHGKILRVSRDNGEGLSDNPFWDGDPDSIRSRVWAVGFRNPFRFTLFPGQPVADVLYSSENGDSTDRVSWVKKGSNGEWNINGDGGGFLNPPDPDHRVMDTQSPSVIGIAIADSGPFAPGGPTLYWANWLNGIRRYQISGTDLDTLNAGELFTADIVGTDMVFGPDGNLYTCHSNGDESLGGFYTLWQITFSGVDPPVASFTTTPSPAIGPAPLVVDFNDTSTAPGSMVDHWQWSFGDGESSTLQDPNHIYADYGSFEARLTVFNTEGLFDVATTNVDVFKPVTVNLSGSVNDGRSLPSSLLAADTEVRFYQLDGSPIVIAGGLGPNMNGILVSAGVVAGSVVLNLTADGFLASAGEPPTDGVEYASIAIEVPAPQSTVSPTLTFYLSDLQIRGRALDLNSQPIVIDVGLAKTTSANWIDVAGGRDYTLASGISPTGFDHRLTSDFFGYFHFAIPSSQGSDTYWINAVADTGELQFASQNASGLVSPAWDLELQIARFGGGNNCDDLSAQPVTADVDFDSQIQPIFDDNCVGCHNATAGNSGGLNLLPGASFSELVFQPSAFATGLNRVQPGSLQRSFLFEKINCETPQIGNRMRPTNAMTVGEQALIRDWIIQLDASCQLNFLQQLASWPQNNILNLLSFVCI